MEELGKKSVPRRMDFIMKPVSYKEVDGNLHVVFEMTPDPKRYESIEFEGKTALLDRSTHTVIPWDEFAEGMTLSEEIPLVMTSPKELDFCAYLKDRKAELLNNWDNKYLLEPNQRPIEELLARLSGRKTYTVILYVDLESSTRLSSEMDAEEYIKVIKIFLMQMSKIIDNFQGYVLKFVGDCVIGIFPAEENFINTCDNAIQASIIMRSTVEDVINPVFSAKGLPEIGFHIGIDIGSVKADSFGALDVTSVIDLIGYSMNLTAKIQSKAGHNEILIGRQLYESLHIDWQEHCEKVELEKWETKDPQRETIYEVYRCKAKWICKCWGE